MNKLTLAELVKEKQATHYIVCQKGYNVVYPEQGSLTEYRKFDDQVFGCFEMKPANGVSRDGVEYTYESDWVILKTGAKVRVRI